MPLIPIINKDTDQIGSYLAEKVYEPKTQRMLVLIIVCIVLLLDNMLYMVIVPIIPVYLRGECAGDLNGTCITHEDWHKHKHENGTLFPLVTYHGNKKEDASVGVLFASKAIVQLFVSPFSGGIIDRFGYDMPMIFGLSVIFFSTAIFAFGTSYSVLFIARSLQGVGSAFADTAGLAMIADRYKEESARSKAQGIALAFISFGCLFAPPFGGILYEAAGKALPFLLLALLALIDGLMLLLVMKPVRQERALLKAQNELPKGTPIYKLILDPYIAICAGALVMANVSLSFLEPTISLWMKDTMNATESQMGLVWLPAFFPHVLGVYVTVKLVQHYPTYQWLITAVGLVLEGFSCLIVPFCTVYGALFIPLMIDCFGIALVDTAMLPTLGYLVDVRHVSVYGSVYAIADISYCLAYAFGPIIAGGIVSSIGFTWLNVGIFVSNIIYAPFLFALRNIYKYREFENETDALTSQQYTNGGGGGGEHYKTYVMNNLTGTTAKDEKNGLYPVVNGKMHDNYQNGYQDGVMGPRKVLQAADSDDSNSDFKSYH